MTFKSLKGKNIDVKIARYFINWDEKSLSKFQWEVKQFLKPYWSGHLCLEEAAVIPNSRMRIDILNLTKKIAIECNGFQHDDPTAFYHKNKQSFLNQIERDLEKERFCVYNDITFVEIYESDMPLSEEFFKEKYNIDL